MEKFPDLDVGVNALNGGPLKSYGYANASANGSANGNGNGHHHHHHNQRWFPRSDSQAARSVKWDANGYGYGYGHNRQKSISDAIRTIRSRHGSVSQNAHEIADALKAPVSPKLIILCVMWYASSALTNTSTKSILNAFDKPATLTLVQFAFVSSYCVLLSWLASVSPAFRSAVPALRHGIRPPTRDVIRTTLPLAAFQIGGHILSSTATSKIDVSLVHTIKGLSPLFTVFAYRLIFDIRYPAATYYSLVPLTLGVVLACSGKHQFGGEFLGIMYALLATIIFVTQNIFSKRLFNDAARAEAEGLGSRSRKLDKLNLLCYSSGLAFVLTVPIWAWSEGIGILGDFLYDGSVDLVKGPKSFDHGRLFVEFVFNGTFHFGQNIMAFVLLSLVSPVTYSVASLIKRVFVIVIALIWFRSPTTKLQAVGIALTFAGLYLYDRTKEGNRADRKAGSLTKASKNDHLLPLSVTTTVNMAGVRGAGAAVGAAINGNGAPMIFESPVAAKPYVNGYALPPRSEDDKKSDEQPGRGRGRGASTSTWMPPGTRQEDTWRLGDEAVKEI